jgi:AraC-like DNA-binding protein
MYRRELLAGRASTAAAASVDRDPRYDMTSDPVPSSYDELAPPPELAPLVACLWRQTAGEDQVQRVVPDGCVDLLWVTDGSEVRAEVAGPDTGVHLESLHVGTSIAGVRFRPGAAATVLGVPLHALRDGRVPLPEVWGREAGELTERVLSADRPEAAASRAVLDRLVRRPDVAGLPDGWPPSGPGLAEALAGRAGPGTVRQMAEDLGLSERQLHRRCLVAFGYGPKTVQRVLRFQAALRDARAGRRLADVAADAGYADQAHMSREVRDLAGVPMTDLLL